MDNGLFARCYTTRVCVYCCMNKSVDQSVIYCTRVTMLVLCVRESVSTVCMIEVESFIKSIVCEHLYCSKCSYHSDCVGIEVQ